jgi:hypothetical protein
MTNTTTGTNYDGEVREQDCCPMVTDSIHAPTQGIEPLDNDAAPFVHHPQRSQPENILTKTHCATDATVFEDFKVACYSIVYNSKFPGNETKIPYGKNVPVTKHVHLIRSPMDNLVARKHMAVRHSVRAGTISDPNRAEFLLNDTAESFQEWCRFFDERHLPGIVFHHNQTNTMRDWLAEVTKSPGYMPIPCVSDLFWYVTWHNFATQLTANKGDVHLLYYEDYSTNYNETVEGLLKFLGLSAVASPVEFQSSKTYPFYTFEQLDAIYEFVRRFSTNATWSLLRRYFD